MELHHTDLYKKIAFPFLLVNSIGGFLRHMQMKTEMLSHPSDVSVGLLSCNNLISQHHTSTGPWRHLMRVVLFSSVSNFMTSPLFYSVAHSVLWTCNDNWEEKLCSAQLCTKSLCQELKLWPCVRVPFSATLLCEFKRKLRRAKFFDVVVCSFQVPSILYLLYEVGTKEHEHFLT